MEALVARADRWVVAAAAVALQLTLGTVHAWSVFRVPLAAATGWTIPQVTLAYTLAMLVLGCSAPLGGLALARWGPQRVALLSAFLYGLGTTLAGLSEDRLWLLYLGYGAIGGTGLGLGFIVPVSVVLKWFPDRTGLLGGVAVAGFGAGALVAGPVAAQLVDGMGAFPTLFALGAVYVLVAGAAARFLRDPACGFSRAESRQAGASQRPTIEYRAREALSTWQWYALWSLLFLNVSAGSALLSQAAAMIQEVAGVDTLVGGAFVGMLSVANAAGRLAWTALSDIVGRRAVFAAMFIVQTAALVLMPKVNAWPAFAALGMLVLLCYGGGFGTMAAFAADYFGRMHVGLIFGLLMTACGAGAVAGPLLTASVRQASGEYGPALICLAIGTQVGCLIALMLRRPPVRVANDPALRHSPSATIA